MPRSWAVLLVVVFVSACGGSSGRPTQATPPTTTPGPVQTVVATGTRSLPGRRTVLIPFNVPATGTLDVTVDWTVAANEIDVYLAVGTCTAQQWPNCAWIAASESRDFKPERLRVVGVTAGPYVLDIGSIGLGDESVSYQVVLTTSGLRGQ